MTNPRSKRLKNRNSGLETRRILIPITRLSIMGKRLTKPWAETAHYMEIPKVSLMHKGIRMIVEMLCRELIVS